MSATLTAKEAAERLGVSRRTLGRMLAAGDLAGAVSGPTGWRIPAEALEALERSPEQPTSTGAERLLALADRLTAAEAERESLAERLTTAEADLGEARARALEADALEAEVARLEAALTAAATRTEALEADLAEALSRARVAEALAAERAETLDRLDRYAAALRDATEALTAVRVAGAITTTGTHDTPSTVTPVRRRWPWKARP